MGLLNEITGNTVEEWETFGNNLFNNGEYQRAMEAYDKALALDKRLVNVWNKKGIIFDKSGDYQSAIQAFDVALTICDSDISSGLIRG
jgi:tetratricopeptide (TPR) repeat protein